MLVVKAGFAYWALIFALGFVLGTLRALWGAEALGEEQFILLEVPVMLLASWLAARMLMPRFAIHSRRRALVMGVFAFALLMAAELALAAGMGGEGASAWIASLTHPPGLYGFLGQIAFGLMPLFAVRKRSLL